MKAVGIIVEYNPFHHGHVYHIEQARKLSNAEIVIALMSGPFLQRGEPALVSKWSRTEMALLGGADLVFELPYAYATQKADTFAQGAVSILSALQCHALCFGSESGEIENFLCTLDFLQDHHKEYQLKIQEFIKTGVSYPQAASMAYRELCSSDQFVDLTKPNNILGFQYIKAASDQKLNIQLLTMKRRTAQFHDQQLSTSSIASATSIRNVLLEEKRRFSEVKPYIPSYTYHLLIKYKDQFGALHHWENYWPFLKYRLLHTSATELKNIYEIEEGIENRMMTAAVQAQSFHHFMTLIKTKRYTWTRLQRACIHILTNTSKTEMKENTQTATYLRLLGMTPQGRQYLKKRKKQLTIPIVSKLSSFKNSQINLDIKASRIYSFGISDPYRQALLEQEYKQPPIMLSPIPNNT
ncbi:nucleotidyltransferase [Bacillus sp. 03113]|uniref:nucleotidyltransferase n=1 Tax=Bacillus sp. 03113 TaxID=2578211 RepID=UPI001142650F|nr:nucleotidyltransferase [Bacillus sp. 03113]